MKMVGYLKQTKMCEYCISGCSSHGIEIFVGDFTEGKCEDCGDTEDIHNVIYLAFKEDKGE